MTYHNKIKRDIRKINTIDDFKKYRNYINKREIYYELKKQEYIKQGYIDNNYRLTTNKNPFNFFAKIVNGDIQQLDLKKENALLKNTKFMIVANKEENDKNYNDSNFKDKASMSEYHKFLTIKDLNWQYFNVATFEATKDNINLLCKMKEEAINYTKRNFWSNNIGLYFHPYGFNSVNSLHLHIIDLNHIGPAFKYHNYKNLNIDYVISVLTNELYINKYNKLLILVTISIISIISIILIIYIHI